MERLPPLAPGFVRLGLGLARSCRPTPGEIVRWSGLPPEDLGPVLVLPDQALLDVRHDHLATARTALAAHGPVQVVDWNYRWLRLDIGRIHGLTVGRLRSAMRQAGARPLGRFVINNAYTLVGVRDDQMEQVCHNLARSRINGCCIHPEPLPPGHIAESAAYIAGRRSPSRG